MYPRRVEGFEVLQKGALRRINAYDRLNGNEKYVFRCGVHATILALQEMLTRKSNKAIERKE